MIKKKNNLNIFKNKNNITINDLINIEQKDILFVLYYNVLKNLNLNVNVYSYLSHKNSEYFNYLNKVESQPSYDIFMYYFDQQYLIFNPNVLKDLDIILKTNITNIKKILFLYDLYLSDENIYRNYSDIELNLDKYDLKTYSNFFNKSYLIFEIIIKILENDLNINKSNYIVNLYHLIFKIIIQILKINNYYDKHTSILNHPFYGSNESDEEYTNEKKNKNYILLNNLNKIGFFNYKINKDKLNYNEYDTKEYVYLTDINLIIKYFKLDINITEVNFKDIFNYYISNYIYNWEKNIIKTIEFFFKNL